MLDYILTTYVIKFIRHNVGEGKWFEPAKPSFNYGPDFLHVRYKMCG